MKSAERDFSKLDEVMAYLKANPKVWRQETWGESDENFPSVEAAKPVTACGTTGCLAGHGVLRNGYVPIWRLQETFSWDIETRNRKFFWIFDKVRPPRGGHRQSVERAAAKIFHLTPYEANLLFVDTSEVVDFAFMEYVVEQIKAGRLYRKRQQWNEDYYGDLLVEWIEAGNPDPEAPQD